MSICSAVTDNVFLSLTHCSSKKGAHSRRRKWCCSRAAAAAVTKAAKRPRTAAGSSVLSDLLREFRVNHDTTSCGCIQRRQRKGWKNKVRNCLFVSSVLLMSSKSWKWVKISSMSGGESLHNPSDLQGRHQGPRLPQQDHWPCWCGGPSPEDPRSQMWRQEQL